MVNGTLKILGKGESEGTRRNSQGELFEKLMKDVLASYAYTISEHNASRTLAGMQIDIVGRKGKHGRPMMAECKCYTRPVAAPELHAFFGKYMARWLSERKTEGLFFALPCVNGPAQSFYEEYCLGHKDIKFKLYDETMVLDAILASRLAIRRETIDTLIPVVVGTPYQWRMLYTELGIFIVVIVIPKGSLIPSRFAVFDVDGNRITESRSIGRVRALDPDLKGLRHVACKAPSKTRSGR